MSNEWNRQNEAIQIAGFVFFFGYRLDSIKTKLLIQNIDKSGDWRMRWLDVSVADPAICFFFHFVDSVRSVFYEARLGLYKLKNGKKLSDLSKIQHLTPKFHFFNNKFHLSRPSSMVTIRYHFLLQVDYGGYHIIKQKVFEGALSWVGYEWKFNYKTLDSLRKYVRNFNYKTFCNRYTERICSHSVRRQMLYRTVL